MGARRPRAAKVLSPATAARPPVALSMPPHPTRGHVKTSECSRETWCTRRCLGASSRRGSRHPSPRAQTPGTRHSPTPASHKRSVGRRRSTARLGGSPLHDIRQRVEDLLHTVEQERLPHGRLDWRVGPELKTRGRPPDAYHNKYKISPTVSHLRVTARMRQQTRDRETESTNGTTASCAPTSIPAISSLSP